MDVTLEALGEAGVERAEIITVYYGAGIRIP
jgi:hypothetical protein